MDQVRVRRVKRNALRGRRADARPAAVCKGCGRLTRLVGEGLCGPCLCRLDTGPPLRHSHHAQPAPVVPSGGRKRRGRTPGESGEGDGGGGPMILCHALALLPLPGPPRPALEIAHERRHRVRVFRLQVEEMRAAGKQDPLDYSDPRLCPPLSAPTDESHEDHDDD